MSHVACYAFISSSKLAYTFFIVLFKVEEYLRDYLDMTCPKLPLRVPWFHLEAEKTMSDHCPYHSLTRCACGGTSFHTL